MISSSFDDRTVERGTVGPIGASLTKARFTLLRSERTARRAAASLLRLVPSADWVAADAAKVSKFRAARTHGDCAEKRTEHAADLVRCQSLPNRQRRRRGGASQSRNGKLAREEPALGD
jgi:hypothetical protein